MALNHDGGLEVRTLRAASTALNETGRKAKRMQVLVALAALSLVCGALIQSELVASSSASSRPLKSRVASVVTSPATSAVVQAFPAPVHQAVDLFGDSLGYQLEPYFNMFLAEAGNYTVSDNTFGGTATCDWLGKMAAAALQHPQAAVLVFSGNAFTPCMDGVAPRSPQYYALYAAATEQAIAIFRAVDAHVFLVGTPIGESSVAGWDRLDGFYSQLAQANPFAVTYVDAGAAVETASGAFTWQLPCLTIEPSCGVNRTNIVRSPDGTHFCPDGRPATQGVTGPCDEYSSGAFRSALAIVGAVTQYRELAPASLVHILG
jgi:hypothetical protein